LVQRAQAILLSAEGLANTEVGARVGLSAPMVGRWCRRFQLHQTKRFKLSTDPFFVEKVRDIRDVVGLYLNPPDKALVLGVEEKHQLQALERT
jgi:putative transposase